MSDGKNHSTNTQPSMDALKNPFDSLQNYFDELLSMDEQDDVQASHASQNNHAENSQHFHDLKQSAAQKNPARADTQTQTSSKKSAEAPDFAEPDHEQKQKLQKLLQTTSAKVVVAPKVDTQIKVETEVKVETKTQTKSFVPDPNEIQEWPVETVTAKAVVTETRLNEKTSLDQATDTHTNFGLDPALVEWLPNGRPEWAQSRFDVLLFQVSGLTLAVPLVALGQIQKITDELTPLFGQADWFMGLQPTPSGKIRTVNTAKFVMPERYDENFPKNAKLVVSINGVPWGLAVDSVNQPISIQPDQVKWRGDRSKRPWLAGTVKEHMCALLDIPTIGMLLQSADKNAHKSFR